MKSSPASLRLTAPGLVLTFVLTLTAGCSSVQLIAPYDDQLDKQVTALQTATETFLVKIEREGLSSADDYKKNYTAFYDDEKVAISGLAVRASAIALNSQTAGKIKNLKDTIDQMEKRHQESGLSKMDAAQFEESLDRIFRAILTLELAKKGATSTGSGNK